MREVWLHPEEPVVTRIAEQLRAEFGEAPATAIVLGSGLGAVSARVRDARSASAGDLGLPQSTVVGHAGRVVAGRLGDAPVVVCSGRVHLYEGHPPAVVVRSVRALHAWGVKRLLLTCSAGGIDPTMVPGDLVAISDHINFQGHNPLWGASFSGTRFPDLGKAYDPGLRAALRATADRLGFGLREGVYAAMPGPSYETPAEIRMLRVVGADLVGMSTVSEVIAAAELGLTTAAVALVSNQAAGLTGAPLVHTEVTEMASRVAERMADLFETTLGSLDHGR